MAITYVVGIPRSGKTYYVMYQLWKYFVYSPSDSKISKLLSKIIVPKHLHNYNFAYTNINQFDFSKSDKIKKLDFDDLKNKLSQLYAMYMDKSSDDTLVLKAKEFNLHNVLITIDEVQNFLGTNVDDVLKWWLTYHGHLYQDLIFITQDLSLVNTQYKSNAEFFYRAIPPSARLSTKKFRYTQYRNARMAMNGKISDFTLPAIQDIFNMYVSGAENKSKSVIQKYLIIGAFFAFFLSIGVYMFIHSFKDKSHVKNSSSKVILNEKIKQRDLPVSKGYQKTQEIDENLKNEEKNQKELFEIKCFKEICTYKKVDFPKLLLLQIINDSNSSFIYKIQSLNFTKYFVLVKKDTFNFLQIGGHENDKNKKNNKKGTVRTFNLL